MTAASWSRHRPAPLTDLDAAYAQLRRCHRASRDGMPEAAAAALRLADTYLARERRRPSRRLAGRVSA